MPFTKETAKKWGKKGGQKTAKLYGKSHFIVIGRMGGNKKKKGGDK